MRTIATRTALVAAALMLTWSVTAQALPVHGRSVAASHVYISFGTPYYVDPLLGGPDYPYAVPPIEGHRMMTEKAYPAPGSNSTLHGARAPLALGEASAPIRRN